MDTVGPGVFGVNTEASLLPLSLGQDLLSKKQNIFSLPVALWDQCCPLYQEEAESKQEVNHTLRGCPYSAEQPRVSHAPGALYFLS